MALKSSFKDITKDLFYYSGISKFLLQLSRSWKCPKLLIFMYHRVSPSLHNHEYLAVPTEVFEQQVKFIKDNFKTVSMEDGLKALYEDTSNEIYATVNLDDGYLDNYLYAYPILKKYSVPATIFLTTDFIGKNHIFWWNKIFNIVASLKSSGMKIDIGSEYLHFRLDGIEQREEVVEHINRILRKKDEEAIRSFIETLERQFPLIKAEPTPMLTWDKIKEMDKDLITFGSHTKTHRNLCLLKDDEVWNELADSKKEIEEKLGIQVSEFSYPFGAFDERVKRLVIEAGFKCARTTSKGFNYKNSDRYLLDCIGVEGFPKISFLAARISFSMF